MKWRIVTILTFAISLLARGQATCLKTQTYDPATNSIKLVDCNGTVLQQSDLNSVSPAQSPGVEAEATEDSVAKSQALKSNYEYVIWLNGYTRRVFENQNHYSMIIFVVVNVLVLAGLYFAWIQFKATLHLIIRPVSKPAKKKATSEPDLDDELSSESVNSGIFSQLKFGPDGVAIGSSFIGLIILGFSMGFYLMFLKYVYPIQPTDLASPSAPAYSATQEQTPKK